MEIKNYKQNRLKVLGIILFLIFCLFLVHSSSAKITPNITLNISSISDNSISWQYSGVNIIYASIDGLILDNFDVQSYNFTLNNLGGLSSHTFCLYTNITTDNNCETGVTLEGNDDKFWSYILLYFLFFMGLICIIVGLSEPIIGFGAFIFGCLGIIQSFNLSFLSGFLFVILIIASVFIVFKR